MNMLLSTLLDILQFSACFNQPQETTKQDTIKVAHAREILATVFSKHLDRTQIDALADGLVACAQGRSDSLPSLDAIEFLLSAGELDSQLAQVHAALNDLFVLGLALESQTDGPIRLTITNPHVIDYLQALNLSVETEHSVMLFGTLLLTQDEVNVPLNTKNQLLKRIALSYSAHSPYPDLNLSLWSKTDTKQALGDRHEYQKDGSEHDLRLWTRGNIITGTIRTRLITLPYTLYTSRVEVRLSDMLGVEVRETSVLDGQDRTLITCLRAARYTVR